MKVLLLNPPFKEKFGRFSREQRSPAITKGGTFYYPMWLSYATGLLEKSGFEVKLIDAPASKTSLEEVMREVEVFSPTLLVIDTSTPSIYHDIETAEKLKEVTSAFTILVGTHPSALPEESLQRSKAIDAVARKEYEITLKELADKLKKVGNNISKDELSSIAGISFRFEDKIFHNSEREPVQNLDALPFLSAVYKKHLHVEDYLYTIAQYPQVAIYTGRGCPYQCVYCVYPQVMHGHSYRKRSIGNLIEEFRFIEKELPQVREIFIEDDTFTVDKKRVTAFCEAYEKARLKISWVANSRADVDVDTLIEMKKANCRLLCVGFESGDQKVLNAMKKNLKIEKAHQFVKSAKEAGILIHGCFIVGNPEETKETLQTTLNYAKKLNPDTAQFFPIMVYPGTAAYDWAKTNNYLISEDYTEWNTEEGLHNCMVSRPGLTNIELVEFCDRARKEFYLRPGYILYRLKQLILHPIADGPRMVKSIKVFAKFLLRGTFNNSSSKASNR